MVNLFFFNLWKQSSRLALFWSPLKKKKRKWEREVRTSSCRYVTDIFWFSETPNLSPYILKTCKSFFFFNLFTELGVFIFPRVIRNKFFSHITFCSFLLCPHFCGSWRKWNWWKNFCLYRICFLWLNPFQPSVTMPSIARFISTFILCYFFLHIDTFPVQFSKWWNEMAHIFNYVMMAFCSKL